MLANLMYNKMARMFALIIGVAAVWKFNEGDVASIVNGFVSLIDFLSDQIVIVWKSFF